MKKVLGDVPSDHLSVDCLLYLLYFPVIMKIIPNLDTNFFNELKLDGLALVNTNYSAGINKLFEEHEASFLNLGKETYEFLSSEGQLAGGDLLSNPETREYSYPEDEIVNDAALLIQFKYSKGYDSSATLHNELLTILISEFKSYVNNPKKEDGIQTVYIKQINDAMTKMGESLVELWANTKTVSKNLYHSVAIQIFTERYKDLLFSSLFNVKAILNESILVVKHYIEKLLSVDPQLPQLHIFSVFFIFLANIHHHFHKADLSTDSSDRPVLKTGMNTTTISTDIHLYLNAFNVPSIQEIVSRMDKNNYDKMKLQFIEIILQYDMNSPTKSGGRRTKRKGKDKVSTKQKTLSSSSFRANAGYK
jgi:hypothetical protein